MYRQIILLIIAGMKHPELKLTSSNIISLVIIFLFFNHF